MGEACQLIQIERFIQMSLNIHEHPQNPLFVGPLRLRLHDVTVEEYARYRHGPLDRSCELFAAFTGDSAECENGLASVYAVSIAAAPSRLNCLIACSRILNFWTLPVTVMGNSSTIIQ